MAEIDVTRRGTTGGDPLVERTGFRLSWGAIFAGFVVATALQMVLSTLGVAIGFAAFDPGEGDSARALGIGTAIWAAATALISLYIGGLTTGRLAGILTRGDGMLHGIIMWSLSVLFGLYMLSVGAGRVLGGATDILGRTVGGVAGGLTSGVGQIGAAAINQADLSNVDFGALQREVETTLQQTGNPALSPDSLQAAAQQAGAQATQTNASNEQVAQEIGEMVRQRGGQVSREDLVNVISARTGMSRAEAERSADRVQSAVQSATSSARQQVSQTAGQVQEQVGQAAGDAANYASKAAWAALLAMGLSAAAATFGAGQKARE